MNDRFVLFLVGPKGYAVLEEFCRQNLELSVRSVVVAKEKNVISGYYEKILDLCQCKKIKCIDRSQVNLVDFKDITMIAAGWRWLLPSTDKLIVLHDSLLPRYRGFNPLVSQLINEEKKLGVTAFFANERYDSGDIINQACVEVTYPLKIGEAIEKVCKCYQICISGIIQFHQKNLPLPRKSQNESDATYSVWRDELDYWVKWSDDSEKICRFVDAVGIPYKGARSSINGKIVIIKEVATVPDLK